MQYRREIDGLRAVAVIPVILFHTGITFFSGGFIGVDIFFVISGWLITSIIMSELQDDTFSLLNFYERRARRILPPLLVVVIVCILFSWFLLLPNEMVSFSRSVIAVTTFVSNFLFWRESGYFDQEAELKPLLHTWSLAVEEQYYIFFPLILIIAFRFAKSRSVLAALCIAGLASLALSHWGAFNKPIATFFLLPTRAWELAIGASLALVSANLGESKIIRQTLSMLGIILILLSFYIFNERTPWPSFYTLVPCVGTVLIIYFGTKDTYTGRLLGNRLLVGIGLVSYGLYLWHQPIFAFARMLSLVQPSTTLLLSLSLTSGVLAYLSWRYVEKPFRDKGTICTRKMLLYIGGLSTMLLLFGLVGITYNGFPTRFDDKVLTIDAARREDQELIPCISNKSMVIELEKVCVFGNARNAKIALLGDSHAASIIRALEQNASNLGLGVRFFSFTGCPPIVGLYDVQTDSHNRCYNYNITVNQAIIRDPSIEYVILLARWPNYLEQTAFDNQEGMVEYNGLAKFDVVESKTFPGRSLQQRKLSIAQKYKETITSYINSGKKVILIDSIPEAGWNVPQYLVKKVMVHGKLIPTDGSTSYQIYLDRTINAHLSFDSLLSSERFIRISPASMMCNRSENNRCIVHIDGNPLYRDDDHLSSYGASLLIKELVLPHIH